MILLSELERSSGNSYNRQSFRIASFMPDDKTVLHAVHENDLLAFLEKLGVLEDFNSGKLVCSQCGNVVTSENLAFIYPSEGTVKFVCSSPACILRRSASQIQVPPDE